MFKTWFDLEDEDDLWISHGTLMDFGVGGGGAASVGSLFSCRVRTSGMAT